MKEKKKSLVFYLLIFILMLICIYGIFANVFPDLWPALKQGDEAKIEEFLAGSTTYKGIVYLFLLQCLQIISVVIPSSPITIAGGFAFGTVKAFITLELAIIVSNSIVFIVAKKAINPLSMLNDNEGKRVSKLIRFISKGDPWIMTLLARMIPGIPNGLIPYVSAAIGINLFDFVSAIAIGSALPTLISTMIGRILLSRHFISAALLYIADYLLMYLIYKHQNEISDFISKRKKHMF